MLLAGIKINLAKYLIVTRPNIGANNIALHGHANNSFDAHTEDRRTNERTKMATTATAVAAAAAATAEKSS